MLDKLGQLKDLWKLKSQMEDLKKRLDNMVIKVESPLHFFEITISGSQDVREVKIAEESKAFPADKVAEDLKAVINKAVKDSQAMAAQAMGGLGGMNLPQA